jgi:anti-sigma regulatory factor (Ser/Thr protein kinase)
VNSSQPAGPDVAFSHAAVVYDSDEQLRDRVVPYVEEGLRRDENVLLTISDAAEHVLREALGSAATRVQWKAPGISYDRLGRMYEAYRAYLAEQYTAGLPTRIVAEFSSDSGSYRLDQYLRYESMAHEAYAPYGYPIVCLWDERCYPPEVLQRVRATHPQLIGEQGRPVINADYRRPGSHHGRLGQPLPVAAEAAGIDVHFDTADDLVALRRHFRTWAVSCDLSADEVSDVISAVDEITTNALEHGGPPARVQSWLDGTELVVEVHDSGTTPIPPTAGLYRPGLDSPRGRGLWMARQFAEVVTTDTGSAGTTVCLRFPVDGDGS